MQINGTYQGICTIPTKMTNNN